MFKYSVYVVLFVLAAVQAALLPFNLVLAALVLILSFAAGSVVQGMLLAFFSGLFLDLARGGRLGFTSLSFLVLVVVFSLYQRRFNYRSPLFSAVVILVGGLSVDWMAGAGINWLENLLTAAAAGLLVLFLSGVVVSGERGKLRV